MIDGKGLVITSLKLCVLCVSTDPLCRHYISVGSLITAVRECRCQVVLISSKSLSQLCTPGDKTSPAQCVTVIIMRNCHMAPYLIENHQMFDAWHGLG